MHQKYQIDNDDCFKQGFTDSSVGKESTCNTGDPSLIPGLQRSPEEGIGYPLQYSWASLVVQMVKNLPSLQEPWVLSLAWEDLLEEGMATHSSILAWTEEYSCLDRGVFWTPVFLPGIPMDRGAWQATVHGIAKELNTI